MDVKYWAPEILNQILARVPPKSLLRFRCACKSWRSTIDEDVELASMHLTFFTNSSRNNTHHLLTVEEFSERKCNFAQQNLRIRPIITGMFSGWSSPIASIYFRAIVLQFVGGVALLYHFEPTPHFELYNPSIRCSLQLPTCPIDIETSPWNYPINYHVGFGFEDSFSKEAKVVVVEFPEIRSSPLVVSLAVYAVRTGGWKSRTATLPDGVQSFVGQPLFCKGALYWLALCRELISGDGAEQCCTHMVSFELESETFDVFELPAYAYAYAYDAGREIRSSLRFMFRLAEYVALFDVSPLHTCTWVMGKYGAHQDHQHSWSKWNSTDSVPSFAFELFQASRSNWDCQLLYIQETNKIMLHTYITRQRLFSPENEEKFCLYDLKSHEIEDMGESLDDVIYMAPYVESLVLHNCHLNKKK